MLAALAAEATQELESGACIVAYSSSKKCGVQRPKLGRI
jgi:hypothetical protein